MKSGPRLPQLEKALAQKRRPNTAINKINFKNKNIFSKYIRFMYVYNYTSCENAILLLLDLCAKLLSRASVDQAALLNSMTKHSQFIPCKLQTIDFNRN